MKKNKKTKIKYNKNNHFTKKDKIKDEKVNKENDHIDILIGKNAVKEALKSERQVTKILISENIRINSISEILDMANLKNVLVQKTKMEKLDSLAKGEKHQGIIAFVSPVSYYEIEDLIDEAKTKKEDPFLILLDELEDPHNLGAILRTADAVGSHGIIIPKHRSVQLSSVVGKTSAGAMEYVKVAQIGNITHTINKLKEMGFWIISADVDGSDFYYNTDLTGPVVLVIGNEGKGISRLVLQNSDLVVKIPMKGKVNSLNASNACAIISYEIFRQRQLKGKI